MDLSVLQSNDPAGLIAEQKQKAASKETKNFARNEEQQGFQQTPGSISGADSGQFHIYRRNRRHEIERIKEFEEQLEQEALDNEFKKRKEERLKIIDEKALKKRQKRLKKKEKRVGQP